MDGICTYTVNFEGLLGSLYEQMAAKSAFQTVKYSLVWWVRVASERAQCRSRPQSIKHRGRWGRVEWCPRGGMGNIHPMGTVDSHNETHVLSLPVWCPLLGLSVCPTLCDSIGWSSPGSSVHGILQARLLEWVATWVTAKQTQGVIPLSRFCKSWMLRIQFWQQRCQSPERGWQWFTRGSSGWPLTDDDVPNPTFNSIMLVAWIGQIGSTYTVAWQTLQVRVVLSCFSTFVFQRAVLQH